MTLLRLHMIPGERWIIQEKLAAYWGRTMIVPLSKEFATEQEAMDAIERDEKNTDRRYQVELSPAFFRIVNRGAVISFEKWVPFVEWRAPCETSGWMRHGPLNGDFTSRETANRAFLEFTANRPDYILIDPVDAIPPALAGETRETTAEIMEGAFRIVTMFGIERFKDGVWSRRGQTVFFTSEDAAEAELIRFSRDNDVSVTLIRRDGAEIVTASPGSTSFPRQDTTADRLAHFVQESHFLPGTNIPEHDGAFRIVPDLIGKEGWKVLRWVAARSSWVRLDEDAIGWCDGYWNAFNAIQNYARANMTEPPRVIVPTTEDRERWARKGFVIEAPPIPGAPVTMPADETETITVDTPADAAAIVAGIAAEAVEAVASRPMTPEIGTKLAVYVESDDAWAVDEWTATGWNRIANELTWDEVDAKLRPERAAPPGVNVGDCKIETRANDVTIADVYQWTGKTWKQIAGGVSHQTAQGVVTARANDPENAKAKYVPAANAGAIKQWRRLMKGIRAKLVAIEDIANATDESSAENRMIAVMTIAREALDLYADGEAGVL